MIYERSHETEIPDKFKEHDLRSREEVVKTFIKEYTKPGDSVLDMFAGLGTTLIVSEKLGRIPYGIEYLEGHCLYIISQIDHKENIIHGDARRLLEYDLPPIDLVFTSPLFMNKNETRDPLNGFKTEGTYYKYLNDLTEIFTNLKKFLKPESKVILEVANLKGEKLTTFAWDLGKALSDILNFEGEVIIGWDGPRDKESFGYDHTYCLVFSNM
jgi:DNA modification methylase